MNIRKTTALIALLLMLALAVSAQGAALPSLVTGPGPVEDEDGGMYVGPVYPGSPYITQDPDPVIGLMHAYAVVTRGPLNVHSAPDTDSVVIGRLATGASVLCTGYSGDNWVRVDLGGEVGFAYRSYLSFGGAPSPQPQPTAHPQHHRKAQTENANATVHTHNGGPLHMRENPASKATIVDTYESGSRIRVLSSSNGWYYVQADRKMGYMDGQYVVLDPGVTLGDTPAASPSGTGIDGVVSNPGPHQVLNLRQAPDTSSRTLGAYPNGTYVQVLAVGTDWMHVIVEGKEGYMAAQFVRLVSPNATATRQVVSDTDDHVPLYSNGNTADIMAQVPVGAEVTVKVPDADWSEVVYDGGNSPITGYMQNANLKAEPVIAESSEAVQAAEEAAEEGLPENPDSVG